MSLQLTASPAGSTTRCTIADRPAWCSADHDGDSETRYAHTTLNSQPVEVRDENGKPSVLCIDIEQTDADHTPYIVIHGPHIDHPVYTFDEAARVGVALLSRVVEGGYRLPRATRAALLDLIRDTK